ncbi:MAG: hypothetical protein HC912_06505 [Saprospiraceae bacterium]|nr:hypothetical protein [Saprospiraceae bacterium]
MISIKWLFLLGLMFGLVMCTPKVAEEVTKITTQPPVQSEETDADLSPCPKFKDAPNPRPSRG